MAYPAFFLCVLPCVLRADVPPDAEQAREDAALLREAGVGDDASLIEFWRRRAPGAGEDDRLESLVRSLGSESFEERERATRELLLSGPAALPLLDRASQDDDLEVSRRAASCAGSIRRGEPLWRGAALRELARRRPAGAAAVVLGYAPAADATEEEDVLSTLVAVA